MGEFLVVAKANQMHEYARISSTYSVGFEYNDFIDPAILQDEKELEKQISRIEKNKLSVYSTMHGAFFDVTVFSQDPDIAEISKSRMKQSMEIAKRIGAKAVVFHTNVNPWLTTSVYEERAVSETVSVLSQLLEKYPTIDIYLENMFDQTPELLREMAERLCQYDNFGVCFDYAHGMISDTPITQWIEALQPYIRHLHINDNDGQKDLHLAVGDGVINWQQFKAYYQKYFTNCSVLIEVNHPKDQEKSIQYLRRLGVMPGAITEEDSAESLVEHIFYYMNQLASVNDFHKTIGILTELGRSLVNADRASFWFWDKNKKQYWTLAAVGSEKIIVDEGAGIIGASLETNQTIVMNDPYHDERFNPDVDKRTGYRTCSILCMPVTDTRGTVIGAYQAINKLDAKGEKTEFTEADKRRLSLAAVFCGRTLESYLLYREGIYDPLTGLRNRRGFEEYFSHLTDGSIIMTDIDFFKKVNDVYGHNAGDAVLHHVADLLSQSVEAEDAVVRWGGEEFLVLLPGRSHEQAMEIAESLRCQIENTVCHFEDHEIKITMSFGVNELDLNATAKVNVEWVDEKLYHSKNTGRNKVTG